MLLRPQRGAIGCGSFRRTVGRVSCTPAAVRAGLVLRSLVFCWGPSLLPHSRRAVVSGCPLPLVDPCWGGGASATGVVHVPALRRRRTAWKPGRESPGTSVGVRRRCDKMLTWVHSGAPGRDRRHNRRCLPGTRVPRRASCSVAWRTRPACLWVGPKAGPIEVQGGVLTCRRARRNASGGRRWG